MKKYSTSLIILFALLFVNYSTAQKLNHVLGEVIVEVRGDAGVKSLVADLTKSKKYQSNIQAKRIMIEPMNLWVLTIDPNIDNESENQPTLIFVMV